MFVCLFGLLFQKLELSILAVARSRTLTLQAVFALLFEWKCAKGFFTA